jgi:hypothetical protein
MKQFRTRLFDGNIVFVIGVPAGHLLVATQNGI